MLVGNERNQLCMLEGNKKISNLQFKYFHLHKKKIYNIRNQIIIQTKPHPWHEAVIADADNIVSQLEWTRCFHWEFEAEGGPSCNYPASYQAASTHVQSSQLYEGKQRFV